MDFSLTVSLIARAVDAESVSLGRKAWTKRGGPFGAVVVCTTRSSAAVGTRSRPSSTRPRTAEVMAIRAACQSLGRFDLRGCELYTSCEPCPMCLAAIVLARLDASSTACTRRDAAGIGFRRRLRRPLAKESKRMVALQLSIEHARFQRDCS